MKIRSGPSGTSWPASSIVCAAQVVAGREPAPLVELAVVRQVGLRRDAEDPAAVDDDRAVVDPVAVLERRADHDHRQQVGGGLDELGDRRTHRREEGVLQEQVVDGVAGQAELGEHRDRHALLVQRADLLERCARRWSPGPRSRPAPCTPRPARSPGRRPSRSPRGESRDAQARGRRDEYDAAGRSAQA